MSKVYDDEFKKRIVRLRIEESPTTPAAKENYDYMMENRKLHQKRKRQLKCAFLKRSNSSILLTMEVLYENIQI